MAFLYAAGIVYFVELALAFAGIHWNVWNVSLPLVAIALLAWRPRFAPPRLAWVDALTGITVIAYAVYATIAPVWEWDFWAIWGLKGRVFYEAGTIDWRFLESRWNDFAHPDYPLLLPLNYVYAALLGGGWSDRWLGAVTVAFGVALVVVIRRLAAKETTPLIAGTIAFASCAFALTGSVGLAEAPLIAFAGASLLCIRRAVVFDDQRAMTDGAFLAGLAACTKNEGLALLITIAIALALSKRRLLFRLWPALVIALPWVIVRATYRFPTDLASGSYVDRILHRGFPVRPFVANLNAPWMWIAMLLALLVVPHDLRKRERFVLIAVALQIALYIVIILGGPNGLAWQIETSWGRLSSPLAAPLLVVVMLMLARTFAPEDDLAHAEARSDH
ncbi:MAG TPA: hypothetical protein VF381_01205 [Thermoanaerobaculia bacterium]